MFQNGEISLKKSGFLASFEKLEGLATPGTCLHHPAYGCSGPHVLLSLRCENRVSVLIYHCVVPLLKEGSERFLVSIFPSKVGKACAKALRWECVLFICG